MIQSPISTTNWGERKSRDINGVAQLVTFDALGRATIVTNVLGSFTNSFVNTTFRPSSVNYPNGQSTLFSYYGATKRFPLAANPASEA